MILLKKKNNNRGFTLIEVIFYVSILAIVLVIAVNFLTLLMKSRAKTEIQRRVWENADYAVRRVVFEIKNAKSVYACLTCPSLFDNNVGYLSLETPLFAPSGETTTYVDLYLNPADSRLYIKREGFEAEPITSAEVEVSKFYLKDLAFDSDNIPTSIQVEINVKQKGAPLKREYRGEVKVISTATIK